MLRAFCVVAAWIIFSSGISGQPARTDQAIPMPADRVADSYRLYSSLLPFGETALPNWPHDLLLIQDTTIRVVPSDQKCDDPLSATMNPHQAVHPTADRLQDFAEILEDFDRYCHERLILDRNAFTLSIPFRLLNAEERKEFQTSHLRDPKPDPVIVAKYKGAAALYAFSHVYFNARHTVALLYATDWCGTVCGHGFWLAFARGNGKWKSLRWSATSWIS